ncbi:MAG: hypothetical protein FWC26_03735, partial [Fibromonadales bacterium]|nr:hypothetical protein [Fibromonadales bacterium]
MKKLSLLALIFPTLLFAQTIWNGTANTDWYTSNQSLNAYTITTAEQLAGLAQLVNGGTTFEGKTITLGTNIVLNDTTANGGWKNWGNTTTGLEQWIPIGGSSLDYSFQGSFNGNGKVISGLYINTTAGYQGLFGCVSKGNVSNLGLAGFYVEGGNYVGGIVSGTNEGTILNSYAIGNVSGSNYIGGITGHNSGTVTNSYFVGNVSGKDYVGGIGGSGHTVINSYAIGNVSGTDYVGGILGNSNNGYLFFAPNVINSYYNSDLANASNLNSFGIPKTTTEMQEESFRNLLQAYASLSNADSESNNFMGWTYNMNNYPSLSGVKAPATPRTYITPDTAWYVNNKAAANYTITTAEELAGLAAVVKRGITFSDKTIMLGADIVLNDTNAYSGWRNWDGNTAGLKQWTPINSFQGSFDGNGKVVSGLYINTTSSDQGLFGYGGRISNLGLAGFYVKGRNYVGGIIGYSGTVTNSYAIGNVYGLSDVGGIAGYGNVTNSYVVGNATVTGSNVGGIISGSLRAIYSYYNSDLANTSNFNSLGTPKSTTEMQSNEFYELLQAYAGVLNAANTNNNFMGWVYNANDYPSFSGSKAPTVIDWSKIFAGGNGTVTNPYIIMTKYQFGNFAFCANSGITFQDQYIGLGADIALNDTNAQGGWRTWNNSTTGLERWTPINNFKGSFNGNGRVISGLYISTNDKNQGLFGNAIGVSISNLGLVGFYVKGDNGTGSIIGTGSSIINSYAIGNVSTDYGYGVGGILGDGSGSGMAVSNSYFVGNVSASSKSSAMGGIVGYHWDNNAVTNSFYNRDAIMGTPNSLGTPKTTKEMKYDIIYTNWDFTNVWYIDAAINDGYPILRRNITKSNIIPIPDQKHTGQPVTPAITIVDGIKLLTQGTDYEVTYLNNTDIGTAIATITGKGIYKDTITATFNIVEAIKTTPIAVTWSEPLILTYNGLPQSPNATAFHNGVPISLKVNGSGTNASTAAYTAVASLATSNHAYELINASIQFHIAKAPITPTLNIADIKTGETPAPSVNGNLGGTTPSFQYSTSENGDYATTPPVTQGIYFAKAIIAESANYLGGTTPVVSFAIIKGDPVKIAVEWSGQTQFVYTGFEQVPAATASLPNGASFELAINGEVNAGTYTATARLVTPNVDYELTNTTKSFTIIQKPISSNAINSINNFYYTGEQIKPDVTVRDGAKVLTQNVDYTIAYGENKTVEGSVSVTGKGNYAGTASRTFKIIYPLTAVAQVYVEWDYETEFEYNGLEQAPTARAFDRGVEIELEIEGKQTEAGTGYTAIAKQKEYDDYIILASASKPYDIKKKTLEVTWSDDTVFVYNKMDQSPSASLAVSEPGVELRYINKKTSVGKYKNGDAVFVQIMNQGIAHNYILKNDYKNYEIIKKNLNSHFSTDLPDFEYKNNTLLVPVEVFSDTAALQQILDSIVAYEGFATNTVTKETDDASVLKGKAKVKIDYNDQDGNSQGNKSILAKRVETTQKATATIITDDVSADNYKPLDRSITIVA